MAEQTPSIDWPRRNAALNGNEDLLRQNPAGDASDSPKEQRIPTSLILDYVLDNLPAGNTVFTVNTGTSDPPATGATPVSSFFKNTNSGEWFVIDSTGDSYSLRDNLARITSGAVVSTDIVLTRDDASTVTIDVSSLGGGGGATLYQYDAGNGAWVVADELGITYSDSAGIGTFVVPSNDTKIRSFRVNGATADLAGDNSYSVVFNYPAGGSINQSIATYQPPLLQVINTAAQLGGGPSNALPFVYDEGSSPQIQVTGIASGDLTLRVINLNAFSNWTIIGSF